MKTRFAAGLTLHRRLADMHPGMGAGGKAARVIGVAFIAGLVTNEARAFDERRLDDGALHGRARAEDEGERRGEREGTGDAPMPEFHE